MASYHAVSLLFLLSGFTGLAYEIIWFKRLSLVWGNTGLSVAAVVAAFLLGLGGGGHYLGKLADRVRSPLIWYGLFELFIGVLALGIPLEMDLALRLSQYLYPSLQNQPYLLWLTRFAFTVCIISPPCFLMGGTLPLLIKQFAITRVTDRDPAAWAYAINTLGAAIGCSVTGFYLLPALGLFWTSNVAISMNLGIGLAAMILARHSHKGTDRKGEDLFTIPAIEPVSIQGGSMPRSVLCVVSMLSGCAALILQIVWTRQLTVILGGSTYAFTAMLFVVLLGIALGSLLWQFISHLPITPQVSFATLTLVLCLAVVAGKKLIPLLTYLVGLSVATRASDVMNAMLSVFVAGSLQLVPCLIMGMLFPLMIQCVRPALQHVGATVGSIYASNALGTVLGALVTGMYLIPQIGTIRTTCWALVIYIQATLLVMVFQPLRRSVLGYLCVCGSALSVLLIGAPFDPLLTNRGMYMYGVSDVDREDTVLLSFKEGTSCNVLVTQTKNTRALRINGKVDAGDSGDMPMQLGLAYIPKILRPSSTEILVIGFGSGTTSGASLLFPETRVTCCETEQEVFSVGGYFSHVNHAPQRNSRFSIVFEDGRSYLQGTDKTFDLILSEPSNPWIAGICALYTKEFYDVAKRRLQSDGIFAQWIQTYSFSPEDYACVVRTVSQVFPYCGLIRISDGDTILLASRSSFEPSKAILSRSQSYVESLPLVRGDLSKYFATTNVSSLLLSSYVLDNNGVKRFLRDFRRDPIVTDHNLRLEFDTPAKLFVRDQDSMKKISLTILRSVDERWIRYLLAESVDSPTDGLVNLVNLFFSYGETKLALSLARLGLSVAPENPKLVGAEILFSSDERGTLSEDQKAILQRSVEDSNRTAVALWKRKRFQLAAEVFKAVIAVNPHSATTWANLGVNLQELGKQEEAQEAFKRAVSIDPFNEFVRKSSNSHSQPLTK